MPVHPRYVQPCRTLDVVVLELQVSSSKPHPPESRCCSPPPDLTVPMTGYRAPGKTLRAQYARAEMQERGELRVGMNSDLGVPDACMRWTLKSYHVNVYVGLGYELIGWPPEIPFTNLSDITGYERIHLLLSRWKTGKMYFARLPEARRLEAENHADPLKTAPAPLHFGVKQRQSRSDVKKRRHRPKTNPLNLPTRFVRDGPKSARWVSDEADSEPVPSVVELEDDRIASFDDEPRGCCFWLPMYCPPNAIAVLEMRAAGD
ncbi:hypothetical protein OH76DRAFT_1420583 [Lentinus brumalis]|uniref:Uncharacterized protein n=1 Tax=Lentinus brumalis TaxID=2498619 RepID=A0A371CZJ1_9APHY|nr:hypothetical protein OH76DRAFT_1420583 [Polyporus brumalis]